MVSAIKLKRMLASAAAITALLAAPAFAQEYPVQGGSLAVADTNNDGSITTGEALRVTGGGYAPGASVEITVGTLPTVLGVTIANAAGEIDASVILPAQYAGGTHQVSATGANASGGILVLGMQVTVAAATATTTATTAPPAAAAAAAANENQLAYTGTSTSTLVAGGAVLCAAGGALVLYRKRSLTAA